MSHAGSSGRSSGKSSEDKSNRSSNSSSDRKSSRHAHAQNATLGLTGQCCLLAYWRAFKARRSLPTGPKDMEMLRQLHMGFSARVAEAEAKIARLSGLEGGKNHESVSSQLTGAAASDESGRDAQQLSSIRRSATSDSRFDISNKRTGTSSSRSRRPSQREPTGSTQTDVTSRISPIMGAVDVQAIQVEEPTPDEAQKAATLPVTASPGVSAKVGHASANSMHMVRIDPLAKVCKDRTDLRSDTKARRTAPHSSRAMSKEKSRVPSRSATKPKTTISITSRPWQPAGRKTTKVSSKTPSIAVSMGHAEKIEGWLEKLSTSDDPGFQG